jgi:predicted acyltransferase
MEQEPASPPTPPTSSRLLSIDALRGFDMFWIIGGEAVVVSLAKATNWRYADAIEAQLEHVEWAGFHFYDLIFPLFLFVVGAVLPFSLGSHRQRGESTLRIYWRILRRTVLLFALGLIYNNFLHFDFENLRIAGVLQRIAICYGIAAVIVLHTNWRGQLGIVAVILLGYWALLALVAAPGFERGDFSPEGNLAGYVDREFLPGRIYPEYYGFGDNEGLLSTIPAVATALLGALAGQWLRSSRFAVWKVLGLLAAGGACLAVGYGWGYAFPIIKNLWTSSFVLVAGGWSLLLLAFFYGVIDGIGFRWWAFFFIVIGSNAILAYLAEKFINFHYTSEFLFGGAARHAGDYGPVILASGVVLLKWLVLLYLYRKKLFLRV